MHLRSISMKGFKSFPQRTKLEFGTGVSVIVGPNGSGKSNITDAVLWALGEQSPLAVRGQLMKDVIFAGGHGVSGAGAAEVEVVIDNSDGRLDANFAEISIVRRLARDGEGEYCTALMMRLCTAVTSMPSSPHTCSPLAAPETSEMRLDSAATRFWSMAAWITVPTAWVPQR